MMKLLKRDWPAVAVEEIFETLGLDEQIRGERVTLEEFVEITKHLSQAEAS